MHKHIMVIDASHDILELCTDLFTFLDISTTSDLLSACTLEDIDLIQPDLLIIDYPPGGEHITHALLQQLRTTPTTAAIPVITWTTRPQIIDQHQQWFEDQHIQIVHKPFAVEPFLSTIMEHLAADPQSIHHEAKTASNVQNAGYSPLSLP